eukprot:16450581-Heterocapsa_arctica.AAC.1
MEESRQETPWAYKDSTSTGSTERGREVNKRGRASGAASETRGLDSESGPSPSDPLVAGGGGVREEAAAPLGRLDC